MAIRGQPKEVYAILQKIRDVPHRVVGTWLVYDKERLQGKWQYLPRKGWVRRPT